MAEHLDQSQPEPAATRTGQFGLRTILVITAFAGLAFALLFSVPEEVAGVCYWIQVILVPTVILVTIVYGEGYARAFAIGASVPAFVLGFWYTVLFLGDTAALPVADWTFESFGEMIPYSMLRWLVGIAWSLEFVCGMIGVLARLTSKTHVR